MSLQHWCSASTGSGKPRITTIGEYARSAHPHPVLVPNDPSRRRKVPAGHFGVVAGGPDQQLVMERQSGDAFGQTRYFIITPSAAWTEPSAVPCRRRGPDGHIFTQQIPAGMISSYRAAGMERMPWNSSPRSAMPACRPGGCASLASDASAHGIAGAWHRGPDKRYPSLILERERRTARLIWPGICESLSRGMRQRQRGCGPYERRLRAVAAGVNVHTGYGARPGMFGPYCRSIEMNCMVDQRESSVYLSPLRSLDSVKSSQWSAHLPPKPATRPT